MRLLENILKNKSILLAFSIMIIGLVVLYSDVLSGDKGFYTYDKISALNVKESINKSHEYPYWFPWMMGGVPSVHSAQNISDYYFPNYIMKGLNYMGIPWVWNYIFHLLFAGIGMYLLTTKLNLGRFISIISSLGFIMMPYITAMLVHGHGSQVMTICYMPWVFYTYIKLKNNLSMKNIGIFALILTLQLLRGHIQMAYYTWMMLGLYIIIDFSYIFFIEKKKDFKWFIYTISGLLLSILTCLSLYLPMLSYTPFSTRSSGASGGAGIDYATEYSFSFGEILTFFIPSYYGFGDYTYWGTMTMTNFPNYMGIILLLLSIYGILRYKWTTLKVFCLACGFLFLVLSFGKNFLGFYSIFYNIFPFFSKFRNPMYLLIVVQFCMMILSGMGLKMLYKDIIGRKIFTPISSALCILILCITPIVFLNNILESGANSIKSADKNKMFIAYQKYYENELNKDLSNADLLLLEEKIVEIIDSEAYQTDSQGKIKLIQSMTKSDIEVMVIIILTGSCFVLFSYYLYPIIKNKRILFIISFSLLSLVIFLDMYFVNRKIIHPENSNYLFSIDTQKEYESFYKKNNLWNSRSLVKNTPATLISKGILDTITSYKKEGKIFRVIDPIASRTNEWSKYHIEDILGYHPAKLQSYQNIIMTDYVLNMLNVKYEIKNNTIKERVSAENRAFFVEKSSIINNVNQKTNFYFNAIIPSKEVLITDKDWDETNKEYILTNKDKIVEINNKNPNEITIEAITSGPQFLVVSEIFYPNGWHSTINGKKVKIFKVNDLIRGVYIDGEGSHIVRMWFSPSDLKWGKILSYLGFFIIFILIFSKKIRNYFYQKEIVTA